MPSGSLTGQTGPYSGSDGSYQQALQQNASQTPQPGGPAVGSNAWIQQQGAGVTGQVNAVYGVQNGGAGSIYTPTATQVGGATLAPTATAAGVQNSAASGYQSNLMQQFQNQANGVGPSLAQQQLQMGTDANMRAQAGLAASGRNPALSSYNAQQNQAGQAQTMAGQAANARLQEQYQAQQGLAGLTGQVNSLNQANQQYNAGQANQMNATQAGLQQNQNQFLNQLQATQQTQQNAYQQGLGTIKQQGAVSAANAWTNPQTAIQGVQSAGQMGSGLGTMLAGSDRKNKTGIKGGAGDVRTFLGALKPHSYEYKDKVADEAGYGRGRYTSVMAQELEKAGPVGKSMVKETPDGKMVDYGKGLATMLAAQADLHKRLSYVEGLKANGKQEAK